MSYGIIENESAYEAGKQRRIRQNAAKTRKAKWYAETADATRLFDWLHQSGEFASTCKCGKVHLPTESQYGYVDYDPETCRNVAHPLTVGMFAGSFGELLLTMRNTIWEWGGLSVKQSELVRNALVRAEKHYAEKDQRKADIKALEINSEYVGVVKERTVFEDLTVKSIFENSGQYGMIYSYKFVDTAGNIIMYSGMCLCDDFEPIKRGDVITVKATVKSHTEYNEIKQTKISRLANITVKKS